MALADSGMKLGLRALNGLASSELLDRLGIREPAERLLYNASKNTVRTATTAGRAWGGVAKRSRPARLAKARTSDLFDVTPTDEQQMLREAFASFAAERLRPAAGGYVLSGTTALVPRAADAELFVVAAELEGAGPALFIVESGTRGVFTEPEPAMGLRAAGTAQLVLEDVSLPAGALLGGGSREAYEECVHRARLAWCALAVGTAQAVLDYAIPYVNERVAFGEPISHRQAVAFTVANIAIELDGMRLATYRAASRVDQGLPLSREVTLARRLGSERGMMIGSDGVQLLGGHGYVKEHPVERWYRDLRAAGLMEGAVLV